MTSLDAGGVQGARGVEGGDADVGEKAKRAVAHAVMASANILVAGLDPLAAPGLMKMAHRHIAAATALVEEMIKPGAANARP